MAEIDKLKPKQKSPLVRAINSVSNTIEDHPVASRRAFIITALGAAGVGVYALSRPFIEALSRSQADQEWNHAERIIPEIRYFQVDNHNLLITASHNIKTIEATSQSDWQYLRERFDQTKLDPYFFVFVFIDADTTRLSDQWVNDLTWEFRTSLIKERQESNWSFSIPLIPEDFLTYSEKQKYLAELETDLSAGIYAIYQEMARDPKTANVRGYTFSTELAIDYKNRIENGILPKLIEVQLFSNIDSIGE